MRNPARGPAARSARCPFACAASTHTASTPPRNDGSPASSAARTATADRSSLQAFAKLPFHFAQDGVTRANASVRAPGTSKFATVNVQPPGNAFGLSG